MLICVYQWTRKSWRLPTSSVAGNEDPRLKPREGRRKRKEKNETIEEREKNRPSKASFNDWDIEHDTRSSTSTSLMAFGNTSEPVYKFWRGKEVVIPLEPLR